MALEKEIRELNVLLTDQVEKSVVLTVHQQVKTRIFDRGRDVNNSQIGNYSAPYIKTRVRKGLGASSRVVLEFTGQMRNDFNVVEEGGGLGSGFLNSKNGDKSRFVERTYSKSIFDLTTEEQDLLDSLFQQEVDRILA